jgi:uncharacterized protein YegJ (DUF2314 family)
MYRTLILILCIFTFACTPLAPVPTPVSTTPATDVELEEAIQQARNTLGEFTDRIASPHPDRTFVAVKVRFFPPDGLPQDIWVDEITYTGGSFYGNVGDDLPSLKLSVGEKLVVPTKDIVDWMIVEDGKLAGGYTIRLAYQRMSPEEKERFLETLDYSMED